MPTLTPAQITTLKSLVNADPSALALAQQADDVGLAEWLNTSDPGGYIVWRTDVTPADAHAVMVWTEIDALSSGKARIWEWMQRLEVLDARQPNIRQGISDAFSSASATRTALIAVSKRSATRAEKALSIGAGTAASPSIMSFVGSVSYADASLIRS